MNGGVERSAALDNSTFFGNVGFADREKRNEKKWKNNTQSLSRLEVNRKNTLITLSFLGASPPNPEPPEKKEMWACQRVAILYQT